jgi:hypothetical protein
MKSSRWARATVLAGAALLAATNAFAVEQPKAPSAATQAAAQPVAAELLAAMAQYLAGLQGFEVRMAGSYDAVQGSGEKIEFLELRELAVARPGQLRVKQVRSDGAEDMIVFDGKTMSVLSGAAGVYAQAPQPASLDDAMLYFVRELGMNLPLAPMLSSRFPAELGKNVKSVEYVEYALQPRPAHHLAGRTDAVDFQVWIADGPQPVPLRVVITYRNQPAQPQFRAALLDWKFKAPEGVDAFRFEPPKDARQVAFAVQVPGMAAAAAKGAKP